jgi:hypothetical protein
MGPDRPLIAGEPGTRLDGTRRSRRSVARLRRSINGSGSFGVSSTFGTWAKRPSANSQRKGRSVRLPSPIVS